MDFAILPPEINSARMYTGPGSGSLMAAAGSWDSLANELITTPKIYESVVSGLTTLSWHGPASEAMTASALPYMDWLYTTAEQTKQTAMQARAAAAAFEQAFAMTVPPPAIAANRTQLASLIATNFFGQNTAAIAATEAQYAHMWAQDAAAMYSNAGSSAATAELSPFIEPQRTTNPAGVAAQNAAANQAFASISNTLHGLATGPTGKCLQELWSDFGPQGQVWADISSSGVFTLPATLDIANFVGAGAGDQGDIAGVFGGLIAQLTGIPQGEIEGWPASMITPAVSGSGGGVSALLTGAKSIGPLAVPQSWATPAVSHVSAFVGCRFDNAPGNR